MNAIERFVTPEAPSPAVVKAVYMRQNDGAWNLLMARVFIGTEGDTVEPEEVIYPNFAFVATPISQFRVSSFFDDIWTNGFRISETFPLLKDAGRNANWDEVLLPSHATGTGNPSRRFSAELERVGHFQDRQLVGAEKPYYKSALSRITEFLALDQVYGHAAVRNGEVSLEVPDERGAIRLTPDSLSFSGNNERLALVGQINEEIDVYLNADSSTRRLHSDELGDTQLWLVNQDDEIIDYRSSTEWPYKFERFDGSAKHKKALQEEIQGGESETTEFKNFIGLNDKNKAVDIEKAICALSNRRGGRLFIGVNDEGEIVGIERGAMRNYQRKSNDAVLLYAKEVDKRLQETICDTQCFRSEVMEIFGSTVLVITVTPSSGTNYLHHSNEAYIRTGATSRRMSPPEIKEHRNRNGVDVYE